MAPTLDGRTSIYWESAGRGEPVLLIMGLALGGRAWWRTVPVLSRSLRVITYDHRGVGGSESQSQTYTTEAMASDAVSVLDAAGVEKAHVYGISLGGLVAQQLGLRHPARVRSLVLGATHAGGPRVIAPDREVLGFFRRRPGLPAEEAAWAAVPYSYGPRTRQEQVGRIAEDIARRLALPFPERAYSAQLRAALQHNCASKLQQLRVPTLVVHGLHDRVIPVRNAELMASALPDAQLRILRESGHLYATDEPEVDDAIGAFLAEVP
jgi:pimeloyl-ACP methyl ester carboxylesterase